MKKPIILHDIFLCDKIIALEKNEISFNIQDNESATHITYIFRIIATNPEDIEVKRNSKKVVIKSKNSTPFAIFYERTIRTEISKIQETTLYVY